MLAIGMLTSPFGWGIEALTKILPTVENSLWLILYLLTSAAVWLAYFIGFTYGMGGDTPGKRLFGLTIRPEHSADLSLTLPQIIGRESLKYLEMTLLLGIGLKMQPFTAKRQTWHDMAAKTLVWYTPHTGGTAWMVGLVNGLAITITTLAMVGVMWLLLVMPFAP
jgi:uncharacterized RDD family membrane protein YckC